MITVPVALVVPAIFLAGYFLGLWIGYMWRGKC